jgi:hypothetical protein
MRSSPSWNAGTFRQPAPTGQRGGEPVPHVRGADGCTRLEFKRTVMLATAIELTVTRLKALDDGRQ